MEAAAESWDELKKFFFKQRQSTRMPSSYNHFNDAKTEGKLGPESCGQSYKQLTHVIYKSRVIIQPIFQLGTTLDMYLI